MVRASSGLTAGIQDHCSSFLNRSQLFNVLYLNEPQTATPVATGLSLFFLALLPPKSHLLITSPLGGYVFNQSPGQKTFLMHCCVPVTLLFVCTLSHMPTTRAALLSRFKPRPAKRITQADPSAQVEPQRAIWVVYQSRGLFPGLEA